MTRMAGSLLLSAVICTAATAQQGKRASGPPESKEPDQSKTLAVTAKPDAAEVSPTKIVIKFRTAGEDRVPAEAYEALRRLDPQAASATHRDKILPLTELGKECGLKSVTHVFFGEAAADPLAAADHQTKLVEQIRSRYPARSKRAPGSKTPDLSPYFVLEFDGSKDIRQVRKRFEESKYVESAHFDPLVKTKDLPNDPFLGSRGSWGQAEDDLWGLKRINGPKAWEMTKGRGVVVAVVDTGLDFDHPDIAGNFWVNARETPGNGVDDDGNGFVDDVRGWDFPNNDADPMDDNREGHGTHVSGTIAAVAGNGEGIAGVAPEAKVMVVKAIGAGGSVEFSVAARAILYAISNGADVINCSWGPGPSGIIPLEIEDLVRFGHSLGVVFVFASGNDSRVVTTQSPMNMKEILTVGASEPSDEAMPRSNWGRYLDVLAPGGSHDAPPPPDVARRSILSLKSSVFTDSEAGRALVVGERYVRLSGTSMAAPHVSGVAALVLAANPALTNEDVMNVVKASAASRSPVRFDLKEGYGRVDAAAAVALAGKKPPTVQLTAPAENLEIPVGGGTVAVRGKVCGDRLKEYQLFYGRMDEGNQLRPLGDATTTAVDGDIFSWDTSGLPPGCYALRLVATDFDGNRFEDMVQVTKSRPGIVRVQEPSVADAVVSERYVAWAAEKSDALTGETTWDVVVLNRRTGERSVVRNVQTSPIPLAVSDRYLAYCTKAGDADCIEVEDLELHTSYRIEDLRDGVDTLGISGRVVFWHDFEAGLFTCDIPSGRTTKVSGWASVEQPHVADGQAVWLTAAQNVAVCDLATGKVRLLTEDGPRRPKRQPRISGQRIVWLEGSNPNGEQVYDIILYDLRDDRPVFLASVRPLAQSLDISGDLVVWSDARNGNHDVYAYDLATNRESSVTTSGDVEALVCLASRTILWQRLIRVPTRPEGRYEAGIEMLDLSAPPSVTVRARR